MQYARFILLLLILLQTLHAKEIKPIAKLSASDMVTDILVSDGKLYAATHAGSVDIFDTSLKKLIERIKLPNIQDYLGEKISPKIYSIDKINDRILIVSQGPKAYREVYMYDKNCLEKVIDCSKKFLIRKGVFVDEDHILLGLITSEIILYDIVNKKIIYKKFIKDLGGFGSVFADMVLSKDRKTLATADESGMINLFNVKDFKHIKLYKGQNLGKIHKIDFKSDTIITAGDNRRCAIYKNDGTAYYRSGKFKIYTAALNPSAKLGLFTSTFDNQLQLFDTINNHKLALLSGHTAIPTDIEFINEVEFFSSAEEKDILFWSIED